MVSLCTNIHTILLFIFTIFIIYISVSEIIHFSVNIVLLEHKNILTHLIIATKYRQYQQCYVSCVILLDKYDYFLPINNRYISRIFYRISHIKLKCAPTYVLHYLLISSILFGCTISFWFDSVESSDFSQAAREISLSWFEGNIRKVFHPKYRLGYRRFLSRFHDSDQWYIGISWQIRMSRVCTHLRTRLENTKTIF